MWRLWMVLFLCACGSSTTLAEYDETVEAARACTAADTCVLGGSGQCVCPAPINASQLETVQQVADDVDCDGAQVECVAHTNVRCEAGRCVSDESP